MNKLNTILGCAAMLVQTSSAFAIDSVKLMRDVINSAEFETLAAAETQKGFPLLNAIVVTNEINCPCYTVRATFQKVGFWPTSTANNKDVDSVMIRGGSTF